MIDKIIVKGARENNLKNINVEIPRDKLTVITGLSGSGKSTLAFNTIYAEGQRRYVESLSAYARQFLGNSTKPDVDSIEGLSPAISIEQKTTSKNPRSTVGTVTEIYDYLRLLFARIGIAHCPKCESVIKPQSAENITKQIQEKFKNKKIIILAPIIRGQKGTHEKVIEKTKKQGFNKIRIDDNIYNIDSVLDEINLERYAKHWIEIVIDRIKIKDDENDDENYSRIFNSVEQALEFGSSSLIVLDLEKENEIKNNEDNSNSKKKNLKEINRGVAEKIYSSHGACINHHEIVFEELEPRHFSFNSPFGACEECHGIGEISSLDVDLIIDKKKSIIDGGVLIWKNRIELNFQLKNMNKLFEKYKFDAFTKIGDLNKEQYKALVYGDHEILDVKYFKGNKKEIYLYEGVIPNIQRLYKQTDSDKRREHFEKFMRNSICTKCRGKRLKENMLAVRINEKSIIDVTDLSVKNAIKFFEETENKINKNEKFIAKQILKEIFDRLNFLNNVGLSYLNLSRSAGSLSGGEAQRIRLATQIGANLMGVLYVLDEPSIGLHQRDNEKLINTLLKLRDLGNTLIVVEHDEDTMKNADFLIDMGPKSGEEGGEIVASGKPEDVMKNEKSLTGKYLSGKIKLEIPETRRKPKSFIELKGASENNLKNINIKFPTSLFCCITGVSGSGKSTLINQTLVPALKENFGQINDKKKGKYKSIKIPENIDNLIVIDQSPIGKTPRSNPATYIKVFDEIRKIFASTKDAKAAGYNMGRFSFNVQGGRCDECHGDGVIKIEMNFLPDVYIQCSECGGKRYNKETLKIKYKNKNIADVLNMDVSEACKFFENHSSIHRKLNTLEEVGLGYIKLGQSSTTLSGGEAQRIKLTKELSKFKKGNTAYFLDEPTTGLHFEDIRKLLLVLNKLVDKGNSVYVIEHNLEVIKSADYIIDIGPEGGDNGGKIVCKGVPEKIVKCKESYTGRFLKQILSCD